MPLDYILCWKVSSGYFLQIDLYIRQYKHFYQQKCNCTSIALEATFSTLCVVRASVVRLLTAHCLWQWCTCRCTSTSICTLCVAEPVWWGYFLHWPRSVVPHSVVSASAVRLLTARPLSQRIKPPNPSATSSYFGRLLTYYYLLLITTYYLLLVTPHQIQTTQPICWLILFWGFFFRLFLPASMGALTTRHSWHDSDVLGFVVADWWVVHPVESDKCDAQSDVGGAAQWWSRLGQNSSSLCSGTKWRGGGGGGGHVAPRQEVLLEKLGIFFDGTTWQKLGMVFSPSSGN